MQRDHLICALVGLHSKGEIIEINDLKIQIDEHLIECGFTPLGTEDNDTCLLDELSSELMMSLIGRGINRKDRRR